MKKLFFGLLFFTNTVFIYSQECGTDIAYKQLILSNPYYKTNKERLDSICSHKANEIISRQGESSAAVKTIPVVFHIMHNYGQENISDAQVIDAVQRLNADFRKLRSDTNLIAPTFKSIAADCEVEFKLAQKDPNGDCTNGITRTQTLLTYNGNDNVKQLINWEHTKYLNIWVVSNINIGTASVAGYAYYPGLGNNMDGIVVLSDYVGGIGTSMPAHSTTLTHEVGHYLDLPHTWGSSNICGDTNNCQIDDGINDTPNTIGNCHSCNLNANTCGFIDNVQNFMEYSSCRMMYTLGQKAWMDAALNISWTGRQNLWSASNLLATGVNGSSPLCSPVADFFASSQMVCVGTPVSFYDNTWNGVPATWHWSFPGASISTSTNSSETVTYATPGVYTVSLTVYNAAGADSIGKTGYITVNSTVATHTASSYSEGFEGLPVPNNDWTVYDAGGANAWNTTNATSYTGSKCIYLHNFSNNTIGTVDEFISKGFDLTKIASPLASFMLSYAQKYNEDDLLEVYASSNCGTTWSLRYSTAGDYLETANPTPTTPFTPSAQTNWRKEYVNLSPFINSNNVILKFKFTGKGGNNIYIDDINIASYYFGISDNNRDNSSLIIYPNPIEETSQVKIYINEKCNTKLTIFDIAGREVSVVAQGNFSEGEYLFDINKHNFDKGIYIIRLDTGAKSINKKIIID